MSNQGLKIVDEEVVMETIVVEKLPSYQSLVKVVGNLETVSDGEISIALSSCDADGVPVYVVIE